VKLQSGQTIRFKLDDVHMPQVEEVIARMTGDVELEGEITLLSDSGQQRAAFAVVQVPGVLVPLIVPTSRLQIKAVMNKNLAVGRLNVIESSEVEPVSTINHSNGSATGLRNI
jgi:hypothetical protein